MSKIDLADIKAEAHHFLMRKLEPLNYTEKYEALLEVGKYLICDAEEAIELYYDKVRMNHGDHNKKEVVNE